MDLLVDLANGVTVAYFKFDEVLVLGTHSILEIRNNVTNLSTVPGLFELQKKPFELNDEVSFHFLQYF